MRLNRPIETRFRCGSTPEALNLAAYTQLAGSLCKRHAVSLVGTEVPVQPPTACKQMVSGSFNSPSGVLFTFPSRYLCTIGRQRVFSLGRWSSRIPTGFHVSRGTWGIHRSRRAFRLLGCHHLWRGFPSPSARLAIGNSAALLYQRRWTPQPPTKKPYRAHLDEVWAVPISLAATFGIAVAFFSSGY